MNKNDKKKDEIDSEQILIDKISGNFGWNINLKVEPILVIMWHFIHSSLDMVLENISKNREDLQTNDWNKRRQFVRKTCFEMQKKVSDYQIQQHKQNETK